MLQRNAGLFGFLAAEDARTTAEIAALSCFGDRRSATPQNGFRRRSPLA